MQLASLFVFATLLAGPTLCMCPIDDLEACYLTHYNQLQVKLLEGKENPTADHTDLCSEADAYAECVFTYSDQCNIDEKRKYIMPLVVSKDFCNMQIDPEDYATPEPHKSELPRLENIVQAIMGGNTTTEESSTQEMGTTEEEATTEETAQETSEETSEEPQKKPEPGNSSTKIGVSSLLTFLVAAILAKV